MYKNFRTAALVIAFAVTLFLQNAVAQESTFELDSAKSRVEYTVSTTLHTVHGTFQVKSGIVHFNPSTGVASGLVLVDATSGDSGNESRDKKMHKEVLESAKFSEISFVPTRVTGTLAGDSSTLQVEGTFRLHGSDHPIKASIPVQVNGNQLTADCKFVVPYVAWGLKNPGNFVLHVSDKVEVTVVASGHLTQAVAQR
jgi:polyisoprenoid-binding protein YceI